MNMIGILFLIIGVIVLISGILKKKNCTEIVMGKVVDISREEETDYNHRNEAGYHYHSGKNISLYPIFEYIVGENTYVKKSNSSSSRFHIGQDVPIHYNPNNPDEYYANGIYTSFILGAIIIIIGIIAFIFA